MVSTFSKTLMVLLLCLTFVGQVMASTVMSYHMMSMKGMSTQEKSHDMNKMDHCSQLMVSDVASDTSEKSSKDCCTKSCHCFTGGCSNVVMLIKNICNESLIELSPKISSVSSLAQSQLLTSLYKPPILS